MTSCSKTADSTNDSNQQYDHMLSNNWQSAVQPHVVYKKLMIISSMTSCYPMIWQQSHYNYMLWNKWEKTPVWLHIRKQMIIISSMISSAIKQLSTISSMTTTYQTHNNHQYVHILSMSNKILDACKRTLTQTNTYVQIYSVNHAYKLMQVSWYTYTSTHKQTHKCMYYTHTHTHTHTHTQKFDDIEAAHLRIRCLINIVANSERGDDQGHKDFAEGAGQAVNVLSDSLIPV